MRKGSAGKNLPNHRALKIDDMGLWKPAAQVAVMSWGKLTEAQLKLMFKTDSLRLRRWVSLIVAGQN